MLVASMTITTLLNNFYQFIVCIFCISAMICSMNTLHDLILCYFDFLVNLVISDPQWGIQPPLWKPLFYATISNAYLTLICKPLKNPLQK